MTRIIQIQETAVQGVNRPVRCVADDGAAYWCKGHQSGYAILMREWISGCLASSLGLPIPQFELIVCDFELSNAWVEAGKVSNETREGLVVPLMNIVFGSKEVANAIDMRTCPSNPDPDELKTQAAIYLFDRIIRNSDRTEGNSNVLMQGESDKGFFIIDHSNALAEDFNEESFMTSHLFRDSWAKCTAETRQTIMDQFKATITEAAIQSAWNEMPDVWQDQADAVNMAVDTVKDIVLEGIGAL